MADLSPPPPLVVVGAVPGVEGSLRPGWMGFVRGAGAGGSSTCPGSAGISASAARLLGTNGYRAASND